MWAFPFFSYLYTSQWRDVEGEEINTRYTDDCGCQLDFYQIQTMISIAVVAVSRPVFFRPPQITRRLTSSLPDPPLRLYGPQAPIHHPPLHSPLHPRPPKFASTHPLASPFPLPSPHLLHSRRIAHPACCLLHHRGRYGSRCFRRPGLS